MGTFMNYRTFRSAIASALMSLSIAACTTPEIVGRYENASCGGVSCNTIVPEADVRAVLAPPAAAQAAVASKEKTCADFPDRAAAECVAEVREESKSLAEFFANLGTPLGPRGGAAVKDARAIPGTLSILVEWTGNAFNPADRLVETIVEIRQENVGIQSWTPAETAYAEINAGTVQGTSQSGGKLTFGMPASAAVPFSIGAEASAQNSQVETLAIAPRYEKLTPFVDIDDVIMIKREGGFGLNLTGVTLLPLVLTPKLQNLAAFDLFSIKKYKDDKGKWLKPEKLEISAQRILAPRGLGDINAKVTLKYKLRHIVSGDETYQERDDRVDYRTVTKTKEITLFPKSKTAVTTFGLFGGPEGTAVFVNRPGYDGVALCFDSYENAERLLEYLRVGAGTQPGRLGSATIGFTGAGPLNPKGVETLSVRPGCLPP